MKYKNKDNIELNLGGMSEVGRIGGGMDLVQEVIKEVIKMCDGCDKDSKVSMKIALGSIKQFLQENFDIEE